MNEGDEVGVTKNDKEFAAVRGGMRSRKRKPQVSRTSREGVNGL